MKVLLYLYNSLFYFPHKIIFLLIHSLFTARVYHIPIINLVYFKSLTYRQQEPFEVFEHYEIQKY